MASDTQIHKYRNAQIQMLKFTNTALNDARRPIVARGLGMPVVSKMDVFFGKFPDAV